MYKRRGRQSEYQASIKKFLEPNKDPLKRLKSLQHGLEKTPPKEVKEFYIKHSSAIFFVVFTSFSNLETTIQEKMLKGRGYSEVHLRELTEVILPGLECVLVTIPEVVQQKWQFNSICLMLRKLFHPDNNLKLRVYALKLLILWVQVLQENASDACMELFASAVPHFPPHKTPMGLPLTAPPSTTHLLGSTLSLCERYGTYASPPNSSTAINPANTSSSSSSSTAPLIRTPSNYSLPGPREVVTPAVIYPLAPDSSGATDEEVTLTLMEFLLKSLTSQADRIQWEEPRQHQRGFAFLFFLFKLFYLACLYKNFRYEAGLYEQSPPPKIDIPQKSAGASNSLTCVLEEEDPAHGNDEEAGESPLPGAAAAASTSSTPVAKRRRVASPYRMSCVIKLDFDLSNPIYSTVKDLILKHVLMWLLPADKLKASSSRSGVGGEIGPSPTDLIRGVWFTSRDNVNMLLEVFRQGFQMPLSQTPTMRKITELYFGWIQRSEKPLFMCAPQSVGENSSPSGELGSLQRPPPSSSSSSDVALSWEQMSGYEGFKPLVVQAGLQASLRMVIAHTSQVFLLQAKAPSELKNQRDLCKKIIVLYQTMVQSWDMDHETWEYLLAVLLHLTQVLVKGEPPANRESTLGGSLARDLIKTLTVCYLRASMVIRVSAELWDSLLVVLSALTHWRETIEQWKAVMEVMTKVLAHHVYYLDLGELPLQRLAREDQQHRKFRARTKTDAMEAPRVSSFSSINVLPPSRPARPPLSSLATENQGSSQKRGRLVKAKTEDAEGSPLEVPRLFTKRHSTPHDSPEQSRSTNVAIPETITERASGTKTPPIVGSSSPDLAPQRSRTAEAGYPCGSTAREEDQPHIRKIEVTSPKSLPLESPFMTLSASDIQLSLEEEDEEEEEDKKHDSRTEKSSVFVNPHIQSPGPEEICFDDRSRGDDGASTSRGKTSSSSSSSNRKSKGRDSGRSKKNNHISLDLVMKNPKYMSPEPEAASEDVKKSPATTKLRRSKKVDEPTDEISSLKRASNDYSETTDDDGGIRSGRAASECTSTDLHSTPESSLNQSMSVDVRPRERLPSLMRKSSSDSDLRKHGVTRAPMRLSPPPPSSFTVNRRGDNQTFRRVVSTSAGGGEGSEGPDEEGVGPAGVYPDPFSSELIPLSPGGAGTPVQSPTRVPLSRYKPSRVSRKLHSPITSPARDEGVERFPVISDAANEQGHPSSPGGSPPSSSSSSSSSSAVAPPPAPPPQPAWSPVVAALVWQRMLKILGDINDISQPDMHAEALKCLMETWRSLADLEDNCGISLDSQCTPPLPEFMPDLHVALPWVVKACSLPRPSFQQGREVAYQLLCETVVRHWHSPPSPDQLSHFYRLMHLGLQPSSDMLHVAVKAGCRLFSLGLRGSSVLLTDCVQACSAILRQKRLECPRNECLVLLGSMLCLPELYGSVVLPVVDGGEGGEGGEGGRSGVMGLDLKEKLIDILFHAAKKEPTRISRCLALFQTGMLVFSELRSGCPSRRLPEGVDILLASLQFADRGVSMAAIDMLTLLAEVAPQMHRLYPSMPVRVVEALCYAVAVFLTDELERASWVDKVVVTLILCLRDWVMAFPPATAGGSPHETTITKRTLKSVFEVLQAAAGSPKYVVAKRRAISQLFTIRSPVATVLDPLETASSRSPRSGSSTLRQSTRKSGDEVTISAEHLRAARHFEEEDRIQIAARSVLTHLLNLFDHYPFGCGAAQLSSVVREYHDNPSLEHLDELSTDIFDSPRVQFFSFNNSCVITIVEIPAKLEGVPGSVTTASYQSRLIVRDVTGKYCWDAAVLYGPKLSSSSSSTTCTQSAYQPSLLKAESTDSLVECVRAGGGGGVELEPPQGGGGTGGGGLEMLPPSSHDDPLLGPSWQSHINTDRDVLEDALLHLEATSPECVLYPGNVGLTEPAPPPSTVGVADALKRVELRLMDSLQHQRQTEQCYIKEAFSLASMQGEKAEAPKFFPSTFAFHHCRVFLSHLGMLSWDKRSHLDLLEKNNQLILELKHLDSIQTQSRLTYKVAVLYIAVGQEDKTSILSNTSGSRKYEEFVAGLGWEVSIKSHAGYLGGLQREFCADWTLPYFASSSEEVLFHVSTRMPLKVEQKVRHLGNDEVHIVWSEHWRDYRRTIFRTQFADVLIVVYPLHNELFRIQINKKPNVPHFGPLFDGALVDRESLPSLVRATAINALRAQRSPLIGYRGRYEERMKYIQAVVETKMKSSYEHFTFHVMHPLASSGESSSASSFSGLQQRGSPLKALTTPSSTAVEQRTSGGHSTTAAASTHSSTLHHHHQHTKSAVVSTSSSSSGSRPHLSGHSLSHHSSSHGHLHTFRGAPAAQRSPGSSSAHTHHNYSDTLPARFTFSSLLRLPMHAIERTSKLTNSPPLRRPRASTNDERMTPKREVSLQRNQSVPENLSQLGKPEAAAAASAPRSAASTPKRVPSPLSSSKHSSKHTTPTSSTTNLGGPSPPPPLPLPLASPSTPVSIELIEASTSSNLPPLLGVPSASRGIGAAFSAPTSLVSSAGVCPQREEEKSSTVCSLSSAPATSPHLNQN